MSNQFISHSAWYIYLVCALVSLGLGLLLYFRNPALKEAPALVGKILMACRVLGIFLILLLLCDLFLKNVSRYNERPLLLLAVDNSTSMVSTRDSSRVKEFLRADLQEFESELSDRFDVQKVYFGSALQSAGSANFTEKQTDFETLFSELEEQYSNRNVGAVVLISDGIQNKGASPFTLAARSPFPIYSLVCGDTTEFSDLSIRKIAHNEVAYLGNAFPVDVFVEAKKMSGKTAWLKISLEGTEKARVPLNISSNRFQTTVSFTLNAESSGIKLYKVEIETAESENNKLNNHQQFLVDIQDKRQKILLLAQAPHPDIQALKESLMAFSAYEFDFFFASDFPGQLKGYNLAILHGVGRGHEVLIQKLRDENLPYWIVCPGSADIFPGMRNTATVNRSNDSEPIVNQGFAYFTIRNELRTFLEQCPAVKCFFGRYVLSNSASSLLYQKIGSVESSEPLFVFNEIGGLKSACFNGDGLWTWKMRDYAEHKNQQLFNELVSSTVFYLSVKNDKSQFRIHFPKALNENEQVTMEAEVYNKSYEAVNDAEVLLQLRNSKKESFNYSFSSNSRYYQADLGQLAPGEYNFRAQAKSGGETLEKTGTFVVREINAEQLNLVAQPGVLQQIAKRSGGLVFSMSELRGLKTELLNKKEIKTITYSQNSLNRPIEWPLIFFILLAVFGLEWFLRKRYLNI